MQPKSFIVSISMMLAATVCVAPTANAGAVSIGNQCFVAGKKATVSRGVQVSCAKAGQKMTWVVMTYPEYYAFDLAYIRSVTKRITEDTAAVECYLQDGIAVSGRMYILGNQYNRLWSNAPVPPKIKSKDWIPALKVLETFTHDAADMWDEGDRSSSAARFYVAKKRAGTILKQVNRSLGSSYAFYTLSGC